jgi:glycolate oxidase FAD binding subunit
MKGDGKTAVAQARNAAPATETELATLVADCRSRSESLCVSGGRTRLEADAICAHHQLSTAGLTGVIDYEPGELTLIARTGTPMTEIEALLSAQGQQLAFEPGDSRNLLGSGGHSTIGGVVATNASGPRRVIAGACRDHLLGVRFVDGKGRILKSGGRVMKNVTGLDLSKLLCGSYGTLGILTEVALKTLPAAPCQETIILHDVSVIKAVELFAKALATPFEVSGAAFHAKTAWLRLEGLERQVSYRRDRLQVLFSKYNTEILPGDKSRSLWRKLRDVEHFSNLESPLWRILVKPSDAPATVMALESLGGSASIDWGGGLIWYVSSAESGRIRAALSAGHATLVRRGGIVASEIFQPEPAPIASLSAAVRRTFDPAGILNPGLMGV